MKISQIKFPIFSHTNLISNLPLLYEDTNIYEIYDFLL